TPQETTPEPQQAKADAAQESTSLQPQPAILPTPEPARPEMPPETDSGFRLGRLKLIILAMICGVLLIAAFVIWKTLTRPRPTEATNVLRTVQITTWTGFDLNPALSPDGNSIAYSSDHNGNFEIYVKPLTPGARELQLTTDGEQNFEPAWS